MKSQGFDHVASEEAILLEKGDLLLRDLQKLGFLLYRSLFCTSSRRGAQIVGGVLELAYYRAAGDGQAFPTRESVTGF